MTSHSSSQDIYSLFIWFSQWQSTRIKDSLYGLWALSYALQSSLMASYMLLPLETPQSHISRYCFHQIMLLKVPNYYCLMQIGLCLMNSTTKQESRPHCSAHLLIKPQCKTCFRIAWIGRISLSNLSCIKWASYPDHSTAESGRVGVNSQPFAVNQPFSESLRQLLPIRTKFGTMRWHLGFWPLAVSHRNTLQLVAGNMMMYCKSIWSIIQPVSWTSIHPSSPPKSGVRAESPHQGFNSSLDRSNLDKLDRLDS